MHTLSKIVLLHCFALPAAAQVVEPPTPPMPAPVPAPVAETGAKKPLALNARVDGATTLLDIDGKAQKAHDLLGKVVVVNFYSIQCPVQADWDGRLAAIQKEYEKKDVVFLHIDSNRTEIGEAPPKVEGDAKPYENIRAHLAKKKLPFRVLVDHGNKVADLFDARTTPHVFVFGKDGRLVYKGLVDDDQKNRRPDERNDYLTDTLDKLLEGEKVEPFTTKEQGCTIKRMAKPRGEGEGERRGGRGGEKDGE